MTDKQKITTIYVSAAALSVLILLITWLIRPKPTPLEKPQYVEQGISAPLRRRPREPGHALRLRVRRSVAEPGPEIKHPWTARARRLSLSRLSRSTPKNDQKNLQKDQPVQKPLLLINDGPRRCASETRNDSRDAHATRERARMRAVHKYEKTSRDRT